MDSKLYSLLFSFFNSGIQNSYISDQMRCHIPTHLLIHLVIILIETPVSSILQLRASNEFEEKQEKCCLFDSLFTAPW